MSITPEAARAQAQEMATRLDRPAFTRMAHIEQVKLADEASRVVRALLSVFPEPPTTDAEFEVLRDVIIEIRDKSPRDPRDADSADIAQAVLAAGFRRPSPPTDEQIDAAAVAIGENAVGMSWYMTRLDGTVTSKAEDFARAALEAAARVGGAA